MTTHKLENRSKDRDYFIMTPQLVWALSEDPYDYTLWNVIKMVAGDSGECYLTTEDLATLAMMSTGKVSSCRQRLLENNLLTGELRRDPGYPQPVWHLQIPDLWPRNLAWRQNLGDKIKARVEFKAHQKSLHLMKPSSGEEGITPGEEGVTPGETKYIHKDNQKGNPILSPSAKNPLPVKADKPTRDIWDLSRETEKAREELGNWAVPPDAGGDSEWNDGPVDAFAVLAGLNPDILPDRKRRAWGKRLAAIAGEWSSEDHVVGPGDMTAAIKAIPDSDVGWKSYTDPAQKNFAADVGPLLFDDTQNGRGKTWVVG